MWRCTVCNFTMDGAMPERCPKCGAPQDKFIQLEENQVELITRSAKTNDLHMELSALMDDVLAVAKEGQADNLDPGCVKVFTVAVEQAAIIKQMIRAEIQGHVGKGKW